MDNLTGKRLDGRYELREVIGIGGMAVVYKAYDNIDDRIVAIKILKREFLQNDDFRRRFKNESKAIAVLSHPNIVKVYDVSFGDNLQYIVMEYINGIPLKRFIERQRVLSTNDAAHFTIQILRALQHAHEKGIIHRDIKPQNIMLLQDGTIKVTDFGIARFYTTEQRTMTDQAIGSVHYISPEQARGDFTDGKADIYSIGVMLYEMLTGRVPFEADSAVSVAIMQLQSDPVSPRILNPAIPLGLEQITLHAMQKNPAQRYADATAMLADLENFQRNPAMTFEHGYFVDEAPTKYVTGVKNTGPIPEEIDPEDEEYEDDEIEEKSRVVPILAGVAGAFVIVLVILFILFWNFFIKGDTKGTVACPDFIGMNISDIKAKENTTYKDLNIVEKYEENDDIDADVVFEQNIKKGKSLKVGAVVELTISLGGGLVSLPQIIGTTEEQAITALTSRNLKYRIERVESDRPIGEVIVVDPDEGSQIRKGDTVIITVSAGKDLVMITIPDQYGAPEDEAVAALKKLGFTVDVKYVPHATMRKGYVVTRFGNTQRGKGTTVELQVSNGELPEQEYTIPIDLPGDLTTALKKQNAYAVVLLNNKEVFKSPAANPILLGNETEFSFTVTTNVKKGDVVVSFYLNSNYTGSAYKWISGTYNFETEKWVTGTKKEHSLSSSVFYESKTSSSSTSSSSSNTSSESESSEDDEEPID